MSDEQQIAALREEIRQAGLDVRRTRLGAAAPVSVAGLLMVGFSWLVNERTEEAIHSPVMFLLLTVFGAAIVGFSTGAMRFVAERNALRDRLAQLRVEEQ